MKKKIIGIMGMLFALTLFLCGCGKDTETKQVEAELPEEEFAEVLTSHYWLNSFQAISLYQFTEDGKVLKYYYTGITSVPNDEGYYEYYSEDWCPDPDKMVLLENWSGTYTLEGTIVTLHAKQDDYSYDVKLDYSGMAEEDIESYLSYYDGEYFLYEYQFEPDPNEIEQSPLYLYAVGMQENTEPTQKEQNANQDWRGVYRYDDGNQGLYYFVTDVSKTAVSGMYIYSTEQGNYDYDNFSWKIDSDDGNLACELFQNGQSYIYYRLGNHGISVDYPKGWWPDRDYAYICSIDDAREYVHHPLTDDILQAISPEKDKEEATNTASDEEPFYGIWVFASKDEAECQSIIADLKSKNFDAKVYMTTDWENLNSESWYVVSAGEYSSKEKAQAALSLVQASGYSGAYVKYTGSHK